MILHLAELWASLLAAFLVGCLIGAALYRGLAVSFFASAQGAIADAIGDAIDGVKSRLGVGHPWRPEYRRLRAQAARSVIGDAHDGYADDTIGEDQRDDLDWQTAEPEIGFDDDAIFEDRQAPEPVRRTAPPRLPPRAELPAMRPAGLPGPRNGVPDNLQRIRGIGRKNEEYLNSIGIFHFSQIAAWTPAEVRWVARHLRFPERIDRDDWISQATVLGSGGETGFYKAPRDDVAPYAGEPEGLAGDPSLVEGAADQAPDPWAYPEEPWTQPEDDLPTGEDVPPDVAVDERDEMPIDDGFVAAENPDEVPRDGPTDDGDVAPEALSSDEERGPR